MLDIGELVGRLRVDPRGMDEGMAQGESRFQRFGNRLTGLAAGLGIAAGAALVGGLLDSMDQEAIGAKLQAQLGLSGEAEKWGAAAGDLWAEGWGDSVETIGATMKEVVQGSILPDETDETLQDITRRAQIMSDVFDQDVKGSVNAVSQMIRTGLVKDAREGFDLLAAGIQGGVDKAEDLMDTMTEYSTQFRELGISGQQAMGLMSQGLKAGARDADTVADALKEFAIRSKDGSTTSAEGFKAIGLNADKMTKIFAKGGPEAAKTLDNVIDRLKAMKDPVAQDAASVALFGTKSEDLGDALYALDLDTAAEQFGDVEGAIDRAGEAISESDAAKLETFKRSAQQAATAFMADLVPSLSEAGGWIKKNQEWLKPLVEILGGLAVAIIAVNLATRAWTAAQAAWATVQGVATAAQWLFNAALWASPITWIVIGILALIAVIVLIATKTTWFQDLWSWAWGGIKAGAAAVWGWLKSFWGWLVWFYKANVDAVIAAKDGIVRAWNAVIGFLASVKDAHMRAFNAIGDFIAAGFNRGRDAARGAINSIINFVNDGIGAINSLISVANKVPGVNIPTIGKIPRLATGGSVAPRPGGTPVIMGDGGQVEHGIPDDDFRRYVTAAVNAGGGHSELTIILKDDADRIISKIKTKVKARGGNVQTVLGQ